MTTISSFTDVANYIKGCIESGLTLPELDIWEGQPCYVEVWIEEEALIGPFRLFVDVARRKQVSIFPVKEYGSLARIEEARRRFREKTGKGRKGIILYAGDLTPDGWNIYQGICKIFEDEKNIELRRFALNADQTDNLVPRPVKPTNSIYKSFLKEHPTLKGAYKLTAGAPGEFIRLTEKAIDNYLDPNLIPVHKIKEWQDRFMILKDQTSPFCHEFFGHLAIATKRDCFVAPLLAMTNKPKKVIASEAKQSHGVFVMLSLTLFSAINVQLSDMTLSC